MKRTLCSFVLASALFACGGKSKPDPAPTTPEAPTTAVEPAPPACLDTRGGDDAGRGEVLVSAGGGAVGRFLLEAVTGHDYPAAGAAFFLLSLLTVACNLLADLLYSVVDPRVRLDRSAR